jgi:hypothetical protein
MNQNPDSSSPIPEPTPADAAPVPVLKAPVKLAPPSGGLRAPGLSAPAVRVAAAPTPAPIASASVAKLPERPKFVSPMPVIEDSDDVVPVYLPVLAGIAAVASISFAVLLYLKNN